MDLKVQEHSASAAGHGSNGSFGVSVLMVSADAGKGLGLIAGSESISPGFAGKDPIVAVVG
jgi:hypothetical protein